MIQRQELIKKIKYFFGLNIYESKVWIALLQKNIASVGEIAELSEVPRSRVYDVLESLEKKGFAIAKVGKPMKYIAVKPTIALERLKRNILKEAESNVKTLSNLKNLPEFKEIEQLYEKGVQPIDYRELSLALRGTQNIYTNLKEMLEQAKKEVIIVSGLSELKKKISFFKPLFQKLKEKNVRIVVASNADGKESDFFVVSKVLGVPIKKIKINGRFFIVDSEKAIIAITPENDEEDLALLLHSPYFSQTITSFLVPMLY
ncbi:MAG: hypothetical protein NZ889_02920 [Candidatus Pacearchaeota archaeon]|nr:hypothetical protein [Candidatus Pacearchaeota archaeon]